MSWSNALVGLKNSELLRRVLRTRGRLVDLTRGVTTIQIVRIMKKYIADNPDKAHRTTRFIASIALARGFPCKAARQFMEPWQLIRRFFNPIVRGLTVNLTHSHQV